MGKGGNFLEKKNHEDSVSSNGASSPHLHSPFQMGPLFNLSHRVVLAPMTRCRALDNIPQPCHVEFYSQRTTRGGLLITEANAVSQQAIGFPHSPGIFNDEQVKAWKNVVDAVHEKGGIIFCQIWHVGRASHTVYQPNQEAPLSSTSQQIPQRWTILMPDGSRAACSQPRAISTAEISEIVDQFRSAARNAKSAGFDGVEIHGAHGYLIDQFLKDGVNDRTDEYGGSIENRCRLAQEIVEAVADEIGANRTAIRLSPIIDHNEATDSDPLALTQRLIRVLNRYPLAYLHVTEPRLTREGLKQDEAEIMDADQMWSMVRGEYRGGLMRSGGYVRESGMEAVSKGHADMISFGRLFISNPDLPLRFAIDAKLNEYDRSTFYTHHQVAGYTDYPFYINSLTANATPYEI